MRNSEISLVDLDILELIDSGIMVTLEMGGFRDRDRDRDYDRSRDRDRDSDKNNDDPETIGNIDDIYGTFIEVC